MNSDGVENPFKCMAEGCSYSTHTSGKAVYHQRNVHKRDPSAGFSDDRDQLSPVFEQCLDDWFDLSDEDREVVVESRFT